MKKKLTLESPLDSIRWPAGIAKLFASMKLDKLWDIYVADIRWNDRRGWIGRELRTRWFLSPKEYAEMNRLLRERGLPDISQAGRLYRESENSMMAMVSQGEGGSSG